MIIETCVKFTITIDLFSIIDIFVRHKKCHCYHHHDLYHCRFCGLIDYYCNDLYHCLYYSLVISVSISATSVDWGKSSLSLLTVELVRTNGHRVGSAAIKLCQVVQCQFMIVSIHISHCSIMINIITHHCNIMVNNPTS